MSPADAVLAYALVTLFIVVVIVVILRYILNLHLLPKILVELRAIHRLLENQRLADHARPTSSPSERGAFSRQAEP